MANAAVLITNNALNGTITASSQELQMGVAFLLTPHPSERWRSRSNTAYIVLDKGSGMSGDTVFLKGMTIGPNATARVRLSSVDATGAAGDIADVTMTSANFDPNYGALCLLLSSPLTWRYTRVDLFDPDATYVEAGAIVDGLREAFFYNFSPSASIQYVDRARLASSAAGLSLLWPDNTFRRVDLNLEWVTSAQRYGLIQTMDRVNGRHVNVLLILNTQSANLARDCIYGLVTDITPVTYAFAGADIFGKQLRIDERL